MYVMDIKCLTVVNILISGHIVIESRVVEVDEVLEINNSKPEGKL
jgi:hypothetical protein